MIWLYVTFLVNQSLWISPIISGTKISTAWSIFFHDGPNLAEIGDDCHIYGHIFRNVFKGSKPVAM